MEDKPEQEEVSAAQPIKELPNNGIITRGRKKTNPAITYAIIFSNPEVLITFEYSVFEFLSIYLRMLESTIS